MSEEANKSELEKKALEPISAGYTNKVWRTGEGTVVKKYRNFSAGAIIYSLLNMVFFQEIMSAGRRIDSEVEVRDEMGDQYSFPEIVSRDDPWLEMEEVEGDPVEHLIQTGVVEPRETGERFGRMVNDFHSRDCYRNDWNIEDIYLNEGEFEILDLEFGGTDASGLRKKVDRVFIMYQSRLMDWDEFAGFFEGVSKEIDILRAEKALGFIAAFATALVYFWDDGKPLLVIRNWIKWRRAR